MGPRLRPAAPLLLAVALVFGGGSALAGGGAGPEGSVVDRLLSLDDDGDGRLSPAEFVAPDMFRAMDVDADGFVGRGEMRAYFGLAEADRPNVILLVADDLGYAGIGATGARDLRTPHLDALAASGTRFTDAYVTCPVCAPTRAGLLTGRYGQRFGFELNPGPAARASEDFGIPAGVPLLPERLKPLGYATGMVGKWHLGYRADATPTARGFDEFYGFLGGAHPYLPGARGREASILRGTTPVKPPPYLTDAFAHEAVDFIGRHAGGPFFLYVPFNAVHTPLEATAPLLGRFPEIADGTRRVHAAMLAALDDAVGAILAKVRETGLEERTLVLFLSDNGGPTRQTTSSNAPLRGFKGQLLEGGIRVPMIVSWKGRVPAGRTFGDPVISLDVVPTVLAAAGAPQGSSAGLEGVDLLPFLAGGRTGAPHEALFWRYGEQWAVRQGDWKLVGAAGGPPALYHLTEDIGEASDRAPAESERVAALRQLWEAWDAGNLEPAWRGRVRRQGR